MKQGCKVLELCCGDGFNAHYFYRARASSMLCVDFDPKAIAYARRNFSSDITRYELADIRTQMPDGQFDNIIWDAAIEHFTESEIAAMIQESLNFKQQLLVHAVGDKTIQDVFDAMEKYSAKVEWSLERVRIEHGDGMIDDLVSRARKFGVIVVQNPAHFSEPELFHQRWGAKMSAPFVD